MMAIALAPEVDAHNRELMETATRERSERAPHMMDLGLGQQMSLAKVIVPHHVGQVQADVFVNPGSWALLSSYQKASGWIPLNPEPRGAFFGVGLFVRTPKEVITSAAEEYARSLGLYGALVLAKGIVGEMVPSARTLYVDLEEDPDEGGYPTIRFTITVHDPVEDVLQLDQSLQKALYQYLPVRALMDFSFMYQFT